MVVDLFPASFPAAEVDADFVLQPGDSRPSGSAPATALPTATAASSSAYLVWDLARPAYCLRSVVSWEQGIIGLEVWLGNFYLYLLDNNDLLSVAMLF